MWHCLSPFTNAVIEDMVDILSALCTDAILWFFLSYCSIQSTVVFFYPNDRIEIISEL